MFIILLIIFGFPSFLLTVEFLRFLIIGERLYNNAFKRFLEVIVMIGFPILYLMMLDFNANDCCGDSAVFSPDHKLTVYILIALSVVSYFYSSYKDEIASPILEVLTNCFLLFGMIFNILVAIQVWQPIWVLGNLPIGFLFIYQLVQNHKRIIQSNLNNDDTVKSGTERTAWKLLSLNPIVKFPILLILCLPILIVIASSLLLFGQKPDSIVKAFTDTYKNGFSQLDYMCENVQCGGHFLCSVAANGHGRIVSPIRYGERGGKKIICNRQLLIANAFEELIEQALPKFHKIVRTNYNKVGNLVHSYYAIFENKIVADLIYIVMKPLELVFLVTLYTLDKKPENRIAQQYLNKSDRQHLTNAFTDFMKFDK